MIFTSTPPNILVLLLLNFFCILVCESVFQCTEGLDTANSPVGLGDPVTFCIFLAPLQKSKLVIAIPVGQFSIVVFENSFNDCFEALVEDNETTCYGWVATASSEGDFLGRECSDTDGEDRMSCVKIYMTKANDNKYSVVPFMAVRVKLSGGVITSISIDDTSTACDEARRISTPNSVKPDSTVSDDAQDEQLCSEVATAESERPFKVFFSWEGTDKSGMTIPREGTAYEQLLNENPDFYNSLVNA